jgi:hypothetical protein
MSISVTKRNRQAILLKNFLQYIISHMKEVFIAGMVISGGIFAPVILRSFDKYDKDGLTLSVIGLWILSAALTLGFILSMRQAIKEARKEEIEVSLILPELSKQRKKLKWYQVVVLWFYKIALSLYRKAGLD